MNYVMNSLKCIIAAFMKVVEFAKVVLRLCERAISIRLQNYATGRERIVWSMRKIANVQLNNVQYQCGVACEGRYLRKVLSSLLPV
jgi:hypothetical protein